MCLVQKLVLFYGIRCFLKLLQVFVWGLQDLVWSGFQVNNEVCRQYLISVWLLFMLSLCIVLIFCVLIVLVLCCSWCVMLFMFMLLVNSWIIFSLCGDRCVWIVLVLVGLFVVIGSRFGGWQMWLVSIMCRVCIRLFNLWFLSMMLLVLVVYIVVINDGLDIIVSISRCVFGKLWCRNEISLMLFLKWLFFGMLQLVIIICGWVWVISLISVVGLVVLFIMFRLSFLVSMLWMLVSMIGWLLVMRICVVMVGLGCQVGKGRLY